MLFWREGGISVERYTNPDCKPEMEELMKDCPRSRSGAECWLRLCDIEDILGDEYDLERLRELVQADREGRCLVLKCKPNDTVWFIKSAFSMAHFPIEGNYVSIRGVACDGDIYCSAITAYNKINRSFYMSDIGKTVFLTRAEAEAALRREQE